MKWRVARRQLGTRMKWRRMSIDAFRHNQNPSGESTGRDFMNEWNRSMLAKMNFKQCVDHTGPHGEGMTAIYIDLTQVKDLRLTTTKSVCRTL